MAASNPQDQEVMPKFALATWQADGQAAIPLAVAEVTKEIENGLVKQRRPYRAGAKLDNMSLDVTVWTLTIGIFNGCTEPGIPESAYYPQAVNALEASMAVEKAGTLTIGRDGPVRGQIKHCRVVETAELRDHAAVTITFWQDTEDTTTSASFTTSPATALPVLAEDVGAFAQAIGVWSPDLDAFAGAATKLSGLLQSADAFLDDALAAAGTVLSIASLIEAAGSDFYDETAPPASRALLDPEAAPLIFMLRQARDHAGQAQTALLARVPRTEEKRFPTVVSIFDVAAQFAQDLDNLIALNTGKIEPGDFYAIPAGTPVVIEVA